MDDGALFLVESPVVGMEKCLPLGALARFRARLLRAEKGPKEEVGCCKLWRREKANHSWLYCGQAKQSLEHAEYAAGTITIVQIRTREHPASTIPWIIRIQVSLEYMIIGTCALVSVRLPALKTTIVDLGDDGG